MNSIKTIFSSKNLLCVPFMLLLAGCKQKDEQLGGTLLLGGIGLLFLTMYFPRIAEWVRQQTIKKWGIIQFKSISEKLIRGFFFLYCLAVFGFAVCLHKDGSGHTVYWFSWGVISSGFLYYQLFYNLLPCMDKEEKKDYRKLIIGRIKTVVIYSIVFGIITYFTWWKIITLRRF